MIKLIASYFGKKIKNYGVGGKFLDLVKAMYAKVKPFVRSKNGLTNFSNYCRAVRQVCLLSPLLFSLYINDLVTYLENEGVAGVELGILGYALCCMLMTLSYLLKVNMI